MKTKRQMYIESRYGIFKLHSSYVARIFGAKSVDEASLFNTHLYTYS